MAPRGRLFKHLVSGTAPLAQAGGLVLVIIVWASVLVHKMIIFDGHPMLNSLAVLFAIQAVLVLQPTGLYDMVQKKRAAYVHATFVALAAVSFAAALGIVLWHKQNHGSQSPSPSLVTLKCAAANM